MPLQCSVTCGQGKTTRQVLCVNFSEQEVSASECDPEDRPATEQDCAMSQCPSRSSESRPFPSSPNTSGRNNLPRSQSHQWRTGPWGAVRRRVPAFPLNAQVRNKSYSRSDGCTFDLILFRDTGFSFNFGSKFVLTFFCLLDFAVYAKCTLFFVGHFFCSLHKQKEVLTEYQLLTGS